MNILLDIGGSGIKLGIYDTKINKITEFLKFKLPIDKENYNRNHELTLLINKVVEHIKKNYSVSKYKEVCISSGGLIHDNLMIYWGMDIDICLQLQEMKYKVTCCHDGLAHLMANIYDYNKLQIKENIDYPAMCLGFGTGVAFCVTDSNGLIVKQIKGDDEIGSMSLSLKDKGTHGLLGFSAFKKAMETHDFTEYNYHLKQLVNNLVTIYSVKTLFICGGITNVDYLDAYLNYITYVFPCIKNCKNIKKRNVRVVLGNSHSSLLGAYYFSLFKKTQTLVYTYQLKKYLDVLKKDNDTLNLQIKKTQKENIFMKTLGILFSIGGFIYFKNIIR